MSYATLGSLRDEKEATTGLGLNTDGIGDGGTGTGWLSFGWAGVQNQGHGGSTGGHQQQGGKEGLLGRGKLGLRGG
jgi:hypothetical protein